MVAACGGLRAHTFWAAAAIIAAANVLADLLLVGVAACDPFRSVATPAAGMAGQAGARQWMATDALFAGPDR